MIKNLIIIFLFFIIYVLIFGSSSNVSLLRKKAVEAKEFILKGATSIDDTVIPFVDKKIKALNEEIDTQSQKNNF